MKSRAGEKDSLAKLSFHFDWDEGLRSIYNEFP